MSRPVKRIKSIPGRDLSIRGGKKDAFLSALAKSLDQITLAGGEMLIPSAPAEVDSSQRASGLISRKTFEDEMSRRAMAMQLAEEAAPMWKKALRAIGRCVSRTKTHRPSKTNSSGTAP